MTPLVTSVPLFLPSPSISAIHLGPFTIHLYGLCILAGIIAAWWLGTRRFVARGGSAEQLESVLVVAVLAGVVGARVYHVVTDHQLFFGPGRNPWDALKIWQGGLGIWGAIAFGAAAAWIMARRRGWDFGSLADVLAPGILIAQALGRVGNWFNQEVFGRPTTVPWALEIDPAHRPPGYAQYATFHPTFAYELLWCLLGAVVLLVVEKRLRLGHGRLFTLYVLWYTAGRFFIESLRIDPAHQAGGLRLNQYTSLVVFAIALVVFVVLSIRRPGIAEAPFGVPEPAADDAAEPDADEPGSAKAITDPAEPAAAKVDPEPSEPDQGTASSR